MGYRRYTIHVIYDIRKTFGQSIHRFYSLDPTELELLKHALPSMISISLLAFTASIQNILCDVAYVMSVERLNVEAEDKPKTRTSRGWCRTAGDAVLQLLL